ncbi:acetylglutamate kinase [Rubrivirga sp.]|uniref:acetylglutamate kinase n=1 Tax=Rubrivirga sp. TaxID=1885344 RepID=UPI003C77D34C
MSTRTPNPEPRTGPTVVKLGGAILEDESAVAAIWSGLERARAVVVHGGGPQATALARRLGHEPRIVAGRRVTSDLDLEVALYTLRGALNARLVASARAAGVRAVGVSGADGELVTVSRRPPIEVDGTMVDFGHVGDVEGVDPSVLEALIGTGFTPVVATVCADHEGALYNVNADTVASEIAAALGSPRLDLVTEAAGVRRDPEDPDSLLPRLTRAEVEAGISQGWIGGGMRPKLTTALAALDRGVPAVRICGPYGLEGDGGTVVVP